MATPEEMADLVSAIDALLNLSATQQLLQLNSNTCERAYEAYVLSLCMETVRRAGGTAALRGILSGSNPNPIVFRGAPGSMASTNQDFSYVSCSLRTRRFEIHVDVEYQGTSSVLHEIDVSLCDEAHCRVARQTGGTPKAEGGKLLMAFECKFYENTPGVSLGRTFVGLVADCGGLRMKAFVANMQSQNLRRYFSKSSRPEPFLGLIPADSASEERFIRNVEQELLRWAP